MARGRGHATADSPPISDDEFHEIARHKLGAADAPAKAQVLPACSSLMRIGPNASFTKPTGRTFS